MRLLFLILALLAGPAFGEVTPVPQPDNSGTGMPAPVRFAEAGQSVSPSSIRSERSNAPVWKLTGKRELWPSMIRDDGNKTYLQWGRDQAIPAVFAFDRLGREEMVNGYMRGDMFTIDRVHERLLFRIDRALAQARRINAKAPG